MHGVLLIAAAAMGDLKTVLGLLRKGASPNARDRDGWTPLHLAAGWGHAGVIRALLAHGADISACNKQSDTPLHIAFMLDQAEAARVLLETGGPALLRARNALGRTPADWVAGSSASALSDVLAEFPMTRAEASPDAVSA